MIIQTSAVAIPSLTVFGRSLLLITLQVVANAVCLAIAAHFRPVIGLAILAWTIGLRHALDADHISAIDNVTRTLISHGRPAITCGLFFSLGHSTIVIAVNVALVISTSIYNKLEGVGGIGSIVGTAISGSFLFIVGLANSVILCKILHRRRHAKRRRDSEHGETDPEPAPNENMLVMRLLGPLVNFVNRPWKMYPVGVLFGLGFDTASSVALLAISALAKGGENNTRIPASDIIILPLLFTTGMTLVDSLDSVLMLYAYAGFADHSWKLFEPSMSSSKSSDGRGEASPTEERTIAANAATRNEVIPVDQSHDVAETESKRKNAVHDRDGDATSREHGARVVSLKRSAMSTLSITLTTMSILLAFSMSLIEIMGLIEANCGGCDAAASAPDGGGLAGTWWRVWAKASDDYGYIGAGMVGMFVVVVGGWYVGRRLCMILA